MEAMQSRGVPAGPVLNARQLLADPHFRQRGFFEAVDHPQDPNSQDSGLEPRALGRKEYVGRGWKMSEADVKMSVGAPSLGEANEYILGGLLGMYQGETQKLYRQGVTGTAPIGGAAPSSTPLADQVELGWIAGFDPQFDRSPRTGDSK